MAHVVELSSKHQRYVWWHALTAGLIERENSNGNIACFSDDFLKAMIIFNLTNPVFEQVNGNSSVVVLNWKAALTRDRPELIAMLRGDRTRQACEGSQTVDGLRELMVEDVFKPFRGETALQLLRDFPNANLYRLGELFDGIFSAPASHGEFLVAADQVLTGATSVGARAIRQVARRCLSVVA